MQTSSDQNASQSQVKYQSNNVSTMGRHMYGEHKQSRNDQQVKYEKVSNTDVLAEEILPQHLPRPSEEILHHHLPRPPEEILPYHLPRPPESIFPHHLPNLKKMFFYPTFSTTFLCWTLRCHKNVFNFVRQTLIPNLFNCIQSYIQSCDICQAT